jgi:hypothetical protein
LALSDFSLLLYKQLNKRVQPISDREPIAPEHPLLLTRRNHKNKLTCAPRGGRRRSAMSVDGLVYRGNTTWALLSFPFMFNKKNRPGCVQLNSKSHQRYYCRHSIVQKRKYNYVD